MAGGGKGGSEEQIVRLDPRLEEGAANAIALAMQSAALPYRPNRGVTVAGMSPQQQAAFQGADQAAQAFGLPGSQGSYLPQTQTTPEGYRGYSTGGTYDQSIAASLSPQDLAQRNAILAKYGESGRALEQMEGFGPAGGGK